MPGQQALHLQRTVAFAAHAHELTVVTDPKDPLYDRSIHYLVDEGLLLSIATHGVQEDVKAQARGTKSVLVFGKQRWKCCTVIDHLTGFHAYKGELVPILECIARHKTSDFGRRLVELVGTHGVRLTVRPLAPAGGAAKARRVMGVENAHRRTVGDQENAYNAQRLDALGVSRAEIAEELHVPLSSIPRLLKLDPEAAPKERKKHAGPKKPGAKKIAALQKAFSVDGSSETQKCCADVLEWVMGVRSTEKLVAVWPEIAGVKL